MARRVLVVDDQFGIRILLQEVLEREGYDVELAANGKEALDHLQRKAFDFVLLDMKIPGMDGLEILKGLRQVQPHVKVAMMTAYGELGFVKEAIAHGAVGHFTKPFDIDELRRFVASQVGVVPRVG
ncbi:response regulator [Ferroacidibacillus organovorans]|uniref:Two-component system response regulator n=1 Tax=Ferroacidibacillus organovorans TaxID=1765683 RepID=A0A101XQ04_9BACL|nr:response regulator [Ferroacidibacillus organovorans]KUO95287.1 two-component system response regulator [Ferroacidibacillus organovorans]